MSTESPELALARRGFLDGAAAAAHLARLEGIDADTVLEGGSEVLELDPDALTESLDPTGSFDPEHWVFEQLSLQLPLVNRCGSDCPGPELLGAPAQDEVIDPRWAALKKLQP